MYLGTSLPRPSSPGPLAVPYRTAYLLITPYRTIKIRILFTFDPHQSHSDFYLRVLTLARSNGPLVGGPGPDQVGLIWDCWSTTGYLT